MLNMPTEKQYYKFLDSIRGIAILMVVAFHAFSFEPLNSNQKLYNYFLQSLSMGVPLFFVLSGFLISKVVFDKEESFSTKDFIKRRFARVYPAFLVSIVLIVLLGDYKISDVSTYTQAINNALTLPAIYNKINCINPVAWSLFVEIHFYILFPLVYFGSRSITKRFPEIITVIALYATSIIFRYFYWSDPVGLSWPPMFGH